MLILHDPVLLAGRAQGNQQDSRARPVDLTDDFLFFIGSEITVPGSGDFEPGVQLLHVLGGCLGDARPGSKQKQTVSRTGQPFAQHRKEVCAIYIVSNTLPIHLNCHPYTGAIRVDPIKMIQCVVIVIVTVGLVQTVSVDKANRCAQIIFQPFIHPGNGIFHAGVVDPHTEDMEVILCIYAFYR